MRGPIIVAVLAALFLADAAVWAWWVVTTDVGYEACLDDPRACAGERHVMPLQRVFEIEGQAGDIGRPQGRVRVMGDLSGVKVGDEITAIGTFSDGGWLVLEAVELHPLRPLKRRLGMAGAAIVVLLLPLVFTVRRWRIVPRWGARG